MTRFRQIFILFALLVSAIGIKAQESIVIHTVNKGQTLYSISKLYNTTVEDIVKMNPESAKALSPGQQLRIPANSSNNAVHTTNDRIGNDGVIYHTIQSGETLYRLSKMYDMKPQEICDANPGLSTSNFRVGETIRIPKSAKNTVKEKKNEKKEIAPQREEQEKQTPKYRYYINHKVKRGETVFSLSRQYKVDRNDILAANPEIEDNKLKRNSTIRIPFGKVIDNSAAAKEEPKEETRQEEIAVAPATRKNHNDGVLNVAVILPFLLDSYAPSEQGRIIEYYQGFLMAVEKLKAMGYSFDISTYDSGPQDSTLNDLLSSGALNETELIIGAMYPRHNKELAKFAQENEIPLVIPFTNKDNEIFRNPMVYCVNALQSFIIPDVAQHFVNTFPNANVVILEEKDGKGNKKEFITKLIETLDINGIPNTTVPMDSITTPESTLTNLKVLLRDDRENIIVPTSSSAATLNTLLPSLRQADIIDSLDVPDYKLFGYPEWQIYAKDTREQMYEVETYFYATFYSHYSMPEVTRFQEEYIKRFNCSIQNIYPRYGMLGYDTGLFFLLAASRYGAELPEKINRLGYTPIQTGFLFERENDGAFINRKVYFIHYSPEYRIEKIDFNR